MFDMEMFPGVFKEPIEACEKPAKVEVIHVANEILEVNINLKEPDGHVEWR